MTKRLLRAAYDLVAMTVVAAVLSCAYVQPAWAYVDPSVMTYTIQALAGVAVALSTVLGVVFRRTRKKLFKLIGIDENARKDVEAPVHRLDADGRPISVSSDEAAAAATARRAKRAGDEARAAYRPTWKRRLVFSLIVAVFFCFTILVVAPYEVMAGSVGSVVFGLKDIWAPVALFAVGCAAALTLGLTLLRGRAFNVALLAVFGLGAAAYVQAMLLNTGLPSADGHAVAWGDYTAITVVSAAVWAAFVAAPLVFSRFGKLRAQGIAVALAFALIIVQGVGVGSLFANSAALGAHADHVEYANSELVVTEEGLFDVSTKSNVVVFILDTYDTKDLQRVSAEDPSMLDEFTGFTWYQDSAGSLIPTRYAIPFLLSGIEPENGQVWGDYTRSRYQNSSFLEDIDAAGYSIGIYSDSIYYEDTPEGEGWNQVGSHTVNVHPLEVEESMDFWGTVKAMTKIALYRDLPWVAKPRFWFYTDEINDKMIRPANGENFSDVAYVMNDGDYFNQLKNYRLTTENVEDGEKGSFRFIHLLGTHVPYVLDENGVDIGLDNSTLDQQAKGSMKIVEEYIKQLKELGQYDNTTIIITADHGYWYFIDRPLEETTSPYMLVKPAQSAELDAEPFKVSTAPVSHMDFPATVLKAMGADYASYGTPMDEVPANADRARPYYMTETVDGHDWAVLKYLIEGDALDMANWQLTGDEWDINRNREQESSTAASDDVAMTATKTD